MHIRDRLRATLAQRAASQICWSCSCFSTQQYRSLQAVATAKSLEHDNTSRETEAPHTKSLPTTPRRIKQLQYLEKSPATVHNGRIGRILSGDGPPRIFRLQQDDRTGAQVWPSDRAPLLVRENPGDNKTPRIQEYSTREKVIKTPRIRKYPRDKIRISKVPIGPSFRVSTRTIQPLDSDTLCDEDRSVPVVPRVAAKVASQETSLGQTSSQAAFKCPLWHVRIPRVKSRRGERSTLSSTPNGRKTQMNGSTRQTLVGTRLGLQPTVRRHRSTKIRRLFGGYRVLEKRAKRQAKKQARYAGLPCGSALCSTTKRGISSPQSEKDVEPRTMRSRGQLRRMLRKVSGWTPATIKSVASFGDNVPAFIGRQRHRRYVIRDAIGREAHIQYTGSAKQTATTESKEDMHCSNGLVEPDSRLMEETEELLQLWVQAPAPSKGTLSSQQAKSSQGTSRSIKSTLEPPASLAERLPSTSASDAPETTDNAVRLGTYLPHATSMQSAASSLGKPGLQDSPRMANWPITRSDIHDVSLGHLTRSPVITAARSLHTGIVYMHLPRLSTSSNYTEGYEAAG